MMNAGCILFGILAITGVSAESTPGNNNDYYDADANDRCKETKPSLEYLDYDRQQDRIIVGYPIEIEEHPSTVFVSIKIDEVQQKSCSGSIVSKRWTVTAGHCVYGALPPNITITAGMTSLDKGGKEYKVDMIKIHDDYSETGGIRTYDIALVRIEGEFDLDGKSIAIATRPAKGDEVAVGDYLFMLGWGYSLMELSYPTNKLHKVEVQVLDEYNCSKILPNYVHDYMFCTASLLDGIHTGMSGDSGGPLFDGKILVGIHVSGYRSSNTVYPDKNMRISTFKQWILDTATISDP